MCDPKQLTEAALTRETAEAALGLNRIYPCGCVVGVTTKVDPGTLWVAYCPMHAAAEKLLEACREAEYTIQGGKNNVGYGATLMTLALAIAEAEPVKT